HGVTPRELWGGPDRGARQRGLVWCADAAIAHSQFTLRELHDATGFPAERLCRLGHVIDGECFCPGPAAVSLRQRLQLSAARLLLFVGRLAVNKRVPVL